MSQPITAQGIILPDKTKAYYCFTVSTPEAEAEKRFIEKYGYKADQNFLYVGIRWLGPIHQAPILENSKPKIQLSMDL